MTTAAADLAGSDDFGPDSFRQPAFGHHRDDAADLGWTSAGLGQEFSDSTERYQIRTGTCPRAGASDD